VPRLRAGSSYSVHDLLILMLVESSNEAAETLASAVGREYFITLMNKKAAAIGLSRTSFIDPSGLGVGNSSTAEDMFQLVRYIYENRRFIFDITAQKLARDAYGKVVFTSMQNFNKISGVTQEFLGGKIGQTDAARETYAGVFRPEFGPTKRPIAVVVLGARESQESVQELLAYLSEFYVAGTSLR
jgi:D-alanyl-D-alanine carboxypeptidase